MMPGNETFSDSSRSADPRRIADVVLAVAVRADADAVFIEPDDDDETYAITFERDSQRLAEVSLDVPLGTAVIARLAYVAALDLAAAHQSSAVVPVQSGDRRADVVITIRPGWQLRADLMVMPRRKPPAKAPPTRQRLSPGDRVGQYRVVESLGEGGMGTVFRVEHASLGRSCALKVLRSQIVDRDPSAAHRFLREARAAARVHHPNIVDVFDFGYLPDGRPYFVMELLEGESLSDRIERGALPPSEVVVIARQLATALAATHQRGIVHADVTPSNVLLVDDGSDQPHVKLVDFGLAELAGDGLRGDDPEMVFGTPSYISPEQLRGLPPTERSDQYALGAVMFELLTGRPPYVHINLKSLCKMHLEAAIPPVTSPHGPLPAKLADIVTTCLQKTPQLRFSGMNAVLAALADVGRLTERRGWLRWLSS